MVQSNATTGDIVSIFARDLGVTESAARFYAQDLRKRGLLRGAGRQGVPVQLSTTEASRWLIAQLCAPSISSAATTIARLRGAEFSSAVYSPFVLADGSQHSAEENRKCVSAFAHGLSFAGAANFGDAIDSLTNDFRSGAWYAWAGDAPYELVLEFIEGGNHLQIFLSRPRAHTATVFQYKPAKPAAKLARSVTQILRLDGSTLEKIAGALGPLHTKKSLER